MPLPRGTQHYRQILRYGELGTMSKYCECLSSLDINRGDIVKELVAQIFFAELCMISVERC